MAEDVIDIIHRLSYDVQDGPIQEATKSISKQISEVERLEKEVRSLSAEFSKTSEKDIAKREEIIKKITANRNAVKALNDEIHENIITNKELHKVLEKEQGLIGSLNTQLDTLKKKRDAATDPKAIQEYNRQIAAVNQRLTTTITSQGPKGGNAGSANLALSNIVRDAPFGVIGVANNVTQLTDSLALLNRQTGSTGASLKAMAGSLAGPGGVALGISIVTSLLTVLVQKYGSLGNAYDELFGNLTQAEKAQKGLSEALKDANKEYEKAVVTVSSLKTNIQLAKDGFLDKDKVVKEYNDTIGKTTGAVKSLDEAERELNKNAEAYIRFTLLKAAANNALEAAAKKAFEAEIERRKTDKESVDYIFSGLNRSADTSVVGIYQRNAKKNREKAAAEKEKDRKMLEDIANDLTTEAAKIAKAYEFEYFEGKGVSNKHIENVFQQKLQDLKTRLAALTASTFQSDSTIRMKVAEEVLKGRLEMDRLFKEKKVTSGQRDILKALVGTIGDAELSKELDTFNKKRIAAHQKIDEELKKLLLSESEQRTQLIRDDFERQSQLIEIEAQKLTEALAKAKATLLLDNEEGRKSGLISSERAQGNADEIERIYTDLLTSLGQQIARKRQDLSFTLFDTARAFDNTFFNQEAAEEAERVSAEVNALANTYIKGAISFEKYQKKLTEILQVEARNRRELNIREVQDELERMQDKLTAANAANFSDKELNVIENRIAELKAQLAKLKQDAAQAGVSETKAGRDLQNETLKERISLFGDLANAGIQAAQTIAAAEEAAVARQIAAQERRVERATAIADRGNAKILQQEEERLQKLNQDREKFARHQTALNAIQTASASLLAVANSAATGDPYSAAARVVAVIAALAAGFAVVKSLTADSTPAFRHGEVDIKGPGSPTSDSINARISRGESVINADATAKNKDILEAINSGKTFTRIDTDRITELSYRQLPDFPTRNLQGIVILNQGGGQDNRQLLKEVKELRRAIEEKPTASWSMDKRGFIAMYQDEINFQNKNKRL